MEGSGNSNCVFVSPSFPFLSLLKPSARLGQAYSQRVISIISISYGFYGKASMQQRKKAFFGLRSLDSWSLLAESLLDEVGSAWGKRGEIAMCTREKKRGSKSGKWFCGSLRGERGSDR